MNIPTKVQGVISDPNTEAQIVILRDEQNAGLLPIWVGVAEGNAISLALEEIVPPRPLTHDLLRDMLNHLNVQVEKVTINEINNGAYFSTLYLMKKRGGSVNNSPADPQQDQEITVDARPSDAIALALRMNVPIYVSEEVLQRKGSENFDLWLEKLNPKDPGPYDA